MLFILTIVASIIAVFLGWLMRVIGAMEEVDVGVWSIMFYVCAALVLIAGFIDLISGIARKVSCKRRREEERKFKDIYKHSPRTGKNAAPIMPPKRKK